VKTLQVIFPYNRRELDVNQGTGIALGNFDGLHMGHLKLITRLLEICKQKKLKSMVYTFDHHPKNVMASKTVTPLIYPNDEKARILGKYDLDYLYFEEFNKEFMMIQPEDFVKKILVNTLNVKYIVVGYNYRFGYKGSGDAELLKTLSERYGFEVEVIMPVMIHDTVVSSSVIRHLIQDGEVDKASIFLTRHYSIRGRVTEGKKLGNKLGFPTINIIPPEHIILPSKGVYITKVRVGGQTYCGVTNVGDNPTVGDIGVRIETHLIDFNGDLYGMEAEILFLKKIRDQKKFKNIQELSYQIAEDVEVTKQYFMNQSIYNKMNLC